MDKLTPHYRNTYAEINLDNIKYNIQSISQIIGANKEIMAIVKAEAYGHGAIEVARASLDAGATMLGVALLDEAVNLRLNGISCPILVMGYVDPSYANIAANMDISVTAVDLTWIKKLESERLDNRVKVHVKIDTGMNRLGLKSVVELNQLIQVLQENPNIVLEGVFTHFATADELDQNLYQKQKELFKLYLSELKNNNIDVRYIHSSNSAGSIRFPDDIYNICRIGIAMYGLAPSVEIIEEIPFELRRVMSLHSTISSVKKVGVGDSISYGATYKSTREEWIATVPIGYADGWRRSLQGHYVLVDGNKCEIIGRVCMDQIMIRLPYEVETGSKVTLIGKQEDIEITADDIALFLGTINYEVTCMISSRVPRIFFENKSIIKVENHLLEK
ncbi:MAG: alanine racemase [Bacillales bacterium]|nr:alanine racemase [Bacillales bacterium]